MRTFPTYEETVKLLNAPWRKAKVVDPYGITAFGEKIATDAIVLAKPYHNDPDGYVSIRFVDSKGELHEFTESDDRIEYVPVEGTWCSAHQTREVTRCTLS